LAALSDWFDNRTGYRKLIAALLIEHIPGGARWRYVWGSCLAFVFTVQLVTGILLMTAYSPGDSTAWSSVYFIQYQMDFGWLIRGLHHFGSQTVVVLLGLHMLQVVIAGAHLPPREVNWWLGLLLLGCVLALSLTGYLLPWDQKGYWATQVATNIAGSLPLAGAWLQKIIVGGPAYGHHTLTRFYTLHVGILPPLVILLTILHLTVFRRHGVTTPKDAEGEGWFWPDQAFRDLVVSLVIFGIMLALVLYGHGNKVEAVEGAPEPTLYDRWAHAGRDGKGANLDAPADPARPYPARPEWYFLFLFQLLKYFPGDQEIIGTIVIPNAVLLLLALLPLLGRGRLRLFGHLFGVLVVTGLLVGAAALTCLAIADDMVTPIPRALVHRIGTILMPATGALLLLVLGVLALFPRGFRAVGFGLGVFLVGGMLAGSGYLLVAAMNDQVPSQVVGLLEERMTEEEKRPSDNAEKFHKEIEAASAAAERAVNLARDGVPAEGAINLLRQDPLTQGPRLFAQICAGCHTYGKEIPQDQAAHARATASDLAGFGTEEWVHRLLINPGHKDYFGRTERTTMAEFIETSFPNLTLSPEEEGKLDADARKQLAKDREDLALLARWLGGHPRRSPSASGDVFQQGLKTFQARECKGCHSYEGEGGTRTTHGPDLTGYGDAAWLRLMIMAPNHPKRYGTTNTMPLFRDLEGPAAAVTVDNVQAHKELLLKQIAKDNSKAAKKAKAIEDAHKLVHLSDVDRELIIRWLLKDYRPVFGGEPIATVTR
jgi:quinol-cytochrome oxidoreductase complex cytochrome b subunit/mono/diheme cytochrome c family protein